MAFDHAGLTIAAFSDWHGDVNLIGLDQPISACLSGHASRADFLAAVTVHSRNFVLSKSRDRSVRIWDVARTLARTGGGGSPVMRSDAEATAPA